VLQRLKLALTKTFFRQLVVEVTLVLTVVLSFFGWEMMRRQISQETQQQEEQVIALASSLATSSSVWVNSRDYSGLQEIVLGMAQFPELRYAMVLDTQGLILAHMDAARRGQYLTDLPEQTVPRTQQMADHVTDVTQPILLGKHHAGWVRVGVANDSFAAESSKTKRDIVLFTIFCIAIGTWLASFTARYQTRRLRHLERVARAWQQGGSHLRADVVGTDEAAQLAGHFNAMLDQIEDRERALQQSETLLRQSQEMGKIGGWAWDVERSSLYWTPETFRIHDMPVEIEGTKVQAAIDKSAACYAPEDREILLKAFWLCVEKGVPYDLECRFVTAKQRQLWVRTQGQAEMRDGKVVQVVGYIADITERKQMEEEIRNLAYFDPLTALPNRRMLTDRLQSAMAGGHRNDTFGGLIYLDLDNFKPLNDTHGHAAGDLLLMEVAQRLLHCVRQIDTVARTGGDEFVVVLNGLSTEVGTAAAECQQVAAKVLAALSMPYILSAGPNAPQVAPIEHHCTASLGVTLFKGQELGLEHVMKKADAAMYQAKEGGRNRIQFDANVR
jgi:diguanylate cyclase (GGDEF)-like protein/PAS domain S-box-containing protein